LLLLIYLAVAGTPLVPTNGFSANAIKINGLPEAFF
jgi:glutaredoxin-related protein